MKKFIAILLCFAVLLPGKTAVFANENVFFYSLDNVNNLQTPDSLNGAAAALSTNSVLTGGINNMGIFLDGKGSNITIPLANRNISSLSFWIKPKFHTALSGKMSLLSSGIFELFVSASDKKINLKIGEKSAVGSACFEDNNWYNIVVTANASTVSVYVNGNKEASLEDSFSFSICQSIAVGSTDDNYFRAVVDEVIGYSYVLSETNASDTYKSFSVKLAAWDNEYYPKTESYPSGIKAAPNAIFNNSKVVKPIDTGFEERNELSAISASDFCENLSVSEDSRSGRFSLKVLAKDEIIFPVKESDNFTVTENEQTLSANNLSGGIAPASELYDKSLKIYAKCSEISLWIKPMNNAKEISFYSKSVLPDAQGSSETYAVIKSDKDRDGVFKTGEDLSLGKWQKITLWLKDAEIANIAKGLYIKANNNSEWLFDDISSSYNVPSSTDFNLSEMANENVIYSDNSLMFSPDRNKTDFVNTPATVYGSVPLKDKPSAINVKSAIKRSAGNIEYNKDNVIKRLTPLSDAWSFDAEDASSHEKQAIYRSYLPKTQFENSSSSLEYTFKLPEEYSEQRIIFSNAKYPITVEANGAAQEYTYTGYITTDWLPGDVRLSKSYTLQKFTNILAVEYRKENDSEKTVFLKNEKSVCVRASVNYPGARIALSIGVSPDLTCLGSKSLSLSVKDMSGSTVYSTKRELQSQNCQSADMIIPALSGEYDFILTYNYTAESFLGINYISLEELSEARWNYDCQYANNLLSEKIFYAYRSQSYYIQKKVSDAVTASTSYAVKSINASGLVPQGTQEYSFSIPRAPIQVVRYINMSTEEKCIPYSGIYLDYGESTFVMQNNNSFIVPTGGDVIILSVSCYDNEAVNSNNLSFTYIDGMYNDYTLSDSGNSVYYINYLDGQKLYKYNLLSNTSEKISDGAASMPIVVRKDEKAVFSGKYIYYPENNEKEYVGDLSSIYCAAFAADNDLLIYGIVGSSAALYCYANKKLTKNSDSSGSFTVSADQNKILCSSGSNFTMLEKYNSIWNPVSVPSVSINGSLGGFFLSNDNNIIYWSRLTSSTDKTYVLNSLNITDGTSEELLSGNIVGVCKNGMLLIYDIFKKSYFLYDTVIRQSYRLFAEDVADVFQCVRYNSDSKEFRAAGNGSIFYSAELSADIKKESYLLSFDGRKTWYSYRSSQWEIVSSDGLPTASDFENSGMTADDVNSIPAAAFDKLVSNGDSILQLDIAVRMLSGNAGYSPSISKITVSSVKADDSGKGLFSSGIVRYDKCDYGSVETIFPIEDFSAAAQCFYFLYIGNDWLYTYKNNRIVKIPQTADELLENPSKSWLTVKQYGLSASELRAVPSASLTSLLTNPGYANSEFGVIYILKSDTDNTEKLNVSFKLHARENYIANDDIVVEIVLSGGDKKIVDSHEFSKASIDSFMNWLENRQNNKGNIFYSLKGGTKQFFINYYMINSINVFDRSAYFSANASASEG